MNDNMMNTMLTFCGGVAVGAVATLLLTPKSGRQVREDIAGYARRGADYARRGGDAAAQIPTAVRSASGAAKDAFGEAMTTNGGA